MRLHPHSWSAETLQEPAPALLFNHSVDAAGVAWNPSLKRRKLENRSEKAPDFQLGAP